MIHVILYSAFTVVANLIQIAYSQAKIMLKIGNPIWTRHILNLLSVCIFIYFDNSLPSTPSTQKFCEISSYLAKL